MGNEWCKKTKIEKAAVITMQTQNVAATVIPYGYVLIYPGKASSQNIRKVA